MRFHSYFNTALLLINAYDGSMPLAQYLKLYFAQHKKHGGKDRKYIGHLCYCYYRLGHALKTLAAAERLRAALFLCTDDITEWNILFDETWMKGHSSLVRKRVAFVQTIYTFDITGIFPWHNALSDSVEAEHFALSHLIQPNLFLRTRPGRKDTVIQKLKLEAISFTEAGDNAIALPNATKIDTVIELNKEAVVQDFSSQQVQYFFTLIPPAKQAVTVWDCCAASGGKSIMAYDYFKHIELTVSDIRASIIHNLQKRFTEAGIKSYHSFVADLSNNQPASNNLQPAIANPQYQFVVADVPCTGSGTWGRTPEQLFFFTEDKVAHYTNLQHKIVNNVIPHVQAGGHLLYITCSVFKKENEDMVATIEQQSLKLVEKRLFAGYDKKADTMFGALFTRQA